jgi:hypothetical protein
MEFLTGTGRVRYYLGVDWADQTHAVWVVGADGAKITGRTVPHTAEGFSEWGRELHEWRAQGIALWAAIERRRRPGRTAKGATHPQTWTTIRLRMSPDAPTVETPNELTRDKSGLSE